MINNWIEELIYDNFVIWGISVIRDINNMLCLFLV